MLYLRSRCISKGLECKNQKQIKSKSKASHETRPDTLAQNKYEMAVKFKHMTVSIKNNIFLSK